jgi:protocatechuate 3,4-dioxygenase beta subunit
MMMKQRITYQRVSRREAFRLAGAAGAVALVGRNIAGQPAAAQQTTTPACFLTPALTEGPYFVDERLNRSDIRTDPTTNVVSAGVPLVLNMSVQRVENGACTPLTGATVDIWHCDALGSYSDEGMLGTGGRKFLRGYQVTDASGAVQFTTIYPGWYQGRAVHIHFKVRLIAGSQTAYEFTSQFFFDDTLSDAVYGQNAPYNTRAARDQRNSTDGIYQQLVNDGTGRKSGDLLLLPVAAAKRTEDGYVGTLDIGVSLLQSGASASAPGGPPPGGGGPGGPGGPPPAG